MRFGLVGSFGTAEQTVHLAREAEAHGWDGFFTWDGISVGPMDTWDPWVLLGALATRTERIRLGAMVFPLARRRPWKVARESITVDHLSGGRLVLPVGLGAVDDGGFARVSGEVVDGARAGRAARRRPGDPRAGLDRRALLLRRAAPHRRATCSSCPDRSSGPASRSGPSAAWPSERSMGRAARWDGVLPQSRTRAGPDGRRTSVRDVVAWVAERRRRAGRGGAGAVPRRVRRGRRGGAARRTGGPRPSTPGRTPTPGRPGGSSRAGTRTGTPPRRSAVARAGPPHRRARRAGG